MKELKPVKETYYLLDSVSEDNLEDDLKRLNEEINKYGLFLKHYQLGMETSLSPTLIGSSEHTLHLSYKNPNQQKKEFNLDLSTKLVIRNNFKNRETDIIVLNGMEMFVWSEGYYKCGDQYLVPDLSL